MGRNKMFVTIFAGALFFGFAARRAPIAFANASPSPQSVPSVHFAAGGNAAEIPATFVENLVFLPVHVNDGKPSLFEIDSTALVSSIDPGRAAEISLQAEISATGRIIRNPLLSLPGVDVPLASISLFAPKDFGAIVGRPYEGTLGIDFLNRVVMEIDYGRETVRLYDPSSYHYDGKGVTLPLTLIGGMPVIRAKFTEPKGKNLEADFLVNTALNESIVFSNRYADAHHLFSSRVSTASASDPQLDEGASVALARMRTFQIGRFTIEDPLAAFPQSDMASAGNAQIAGSIGGGMLRRYAVVFDFPHQQIIFTPASRFRLYDQEDKSGLTLVAGGVDLKRFEVTQVQSGSPGAEAGIQKGDVIAGIDNEPGADMTLASVRELFRQIPHKYKILIERNDKTFEVTITMRHRI